MPNVSIKYGHLIDDSKTTGQPAKEEDFYISQSDPANDCEYPRHCAVGSRRVVSEYAVNDGQGGVRRFGLRYRDGRYDRHCTVARFWRAYPDGFGYRRDDVRLLRQRDESQNRRARRVSIRGANRGAMALGAGVADAAESGSSRNGRLRIARSTSCRRMAAQAYFTLPTKTHTRRMQGTFSGRERSTRMWCLVAKIENATMLRDSTVDVLDFDEFRNVLEVERRTVGVDATMHITRTVKNDVAQVDLGFARYANGMQHGGRE